MRWLAPVVLLAACTPKGLPDREPGVRAPLSSECGETDPTRCLLPWPSNAFTVADATTATGLRLNVSADALPVPDRADYLNTGNGFSRVSGIAVGFLGAVNADAANWDPAGTLDPESPLQLFVAQPGDARYGDRIAMHTEWRDGTDTNGEQWLLIGRPAEPMPANADMVGIALDTVGQTEQPRLVRVALGLEEPSDDAEEALRAYHAPTRALLEEQGVDFERVVRVWDFTTRSADDPTFRMHAMMDQLEASVDDLDVTIDTVAFPSDENIAMIVLGRLTNAPRFTDDDGYFVLDSEGRPTVVGTRDIEFRVEVPAGEGNYKTALYGHGTGGDVTDPAFDSELGSEGIAKVALRFDGWTGDDFVITLFSFKYFLDGSEKSTANLLQSLAGGTVLLTSLDGVLGDALSAATIDGQPNPAAGRRPDTGTVAWLGGSMGGTMGGVMVSADPRFRFAVLNVPGAGWTHMIPYSLLYSSGMGSMLQETYVSNLDLQLAMVMGQGSWDEVDGAAWADEAVASGGTFLMQESIDDPILPNLGTELLAVSLGATQIQPAIRPIWGLEQTDQPIRGGTGLEQYWVPDTGQYDVHGFAARDTLAGDAAREQILHFLVTAWDGAPEMVHPAGCQDVTADGSCDFSGMWEE